MWAVTSQKNGASAIGLQRVLGLGSYDTAWTWLHKLRRAMVRPGRDRLSGVVEVGDFSSAIDSESRRDVLGGQEENVRGRQTENKALIVIAAQEDGEGVGRIRTRRIPDASAESLMSFIEEAIEPQQRRAHQLMDRIRVAGRQGLSSPYHLPEGAKGIGLETAPASSSGGLFAERWLLETHQGAVSREHLDYYMDEFTFRFNRRNSRSRGKLFLRLAEQAVAVGPAPHKSMVRCFAKDDNAQPQNIRST